MVWTNNDYFLDSSYVVAGNRINRYKYFSGHIFGSCETFCDLVVFEYKINGGVNEVIRLSIDATYPILTFDKQALYNGHLELLLRHDPVFQKYPNLKVLFEELDSAETKKLNDTLVSCGYGPFTETRFV